MKKFILILLAALFMFSGCSGKGSNKGSLEYVVNQMLNCPNKDLFAIFEEAMSNAGDTEDAEGKQMATQNKVEEYIDDAYSAYFSDVAYEVFKDNYSVTYQSLALIGGATITVEKLEIVESTSKPENGYDFTTQLKITYPSGTQDDITESGSAYFEENKITDFVFDINGDVAMLLTELR